MTKSLRAFLSAETYFNENEKELDKLEPAWAKAALALRGGPRFGHAPGGLKASSSFIEAYAPLEVFKKRAEKGDGLAVLHAIRYCAEENMPLPTWLALDFNKRFGEFLQPGGPTSLDDAFPSKDIELSKGVFLKGLPRSGKRAAAARRDWQLGEAIWEDVWEREIAEGYPSLDSVLSVVLEQGNYGVEKTKARELVLMVDKTQQKFLGKQKYPGLITYFVRKNK